MFIELITKESAKMKIKTIIILICITLFFISCFGVVLAFQQPQTVKTRFRLEHHAMFTQRQIRVEEPVIKQSIVPTHTTTKKTPLPVIANYSQKTYMDWKKITNTQSAQYQFIREHMTVDEDGFLRDQDGNIGVSLGSYFGDIGSVYEFVLDTGKTLKVVKIEAKADEHTVNGYYHKIDKSIIEFVVEPEAENLKQQIASNGYIWQGNFNNCPDFAGNIVSIYKVESIKANEEYDIQPLNH